MDDPRARKPTLRREALDRIASMDRPDREAQEAALGRILESLPGWHSAGSILLYASAFPEEVATFLWMARTLALGKRLILPRVEWSERRLRLFEVRDPAADLFLGRKGIPEPGLGCREVGPSEVDWALVPGLAFDRRGYRLGRGAGHYDRLLPTLRPEVPTWALILDAQWVAEVPVEPHDRPLSGVADHREVVACVRSGLT